MTSSAKDEGTSSSPPVANVGGYYSLAFEVRYDDCEEAVFEAKSPAEAAAYLIELLEHRAHRVEVSTRLDLIELYDEDSDVEEDADA